MLILVLAANTSFADFPRLASFHAGDAFMPKQLTKRGHRLVFSNGILTLACTAAVLIVITGARVDHLIPLYAVGVFTSFTMSQAGMARHHIRKKEPGWRKGLFINATGAVLSFVVDVVIIVTKFKPAGSAARGVGDPGDRARDGVRVDAAEPAVPVRGQGACRRRARRRRSTGVPPPHRPAAGGRAGQVRGEGHPVRPQPVAGRGPRRARRHRPPEGRALDERVAPSRD